MIANIERIYRISVSSAPLVDFFGLSSKYFSSSIAFSSEKAWRGHHRSGRSYGPMVFQVLSSCPGEKHRDRLTRRTNETMKRWEKTADLLQVEGENRVRRSICIQRCSLKEVFDRASIKRKMTEFLLLKTFILHGCDFCFRLTSIFFRFVCDVLIN